MKSRSQVKSSPAPSIDFPCNACTRDGATGRHTNGSRTRISGVLDIVPLYKSCKFPFKVTDSGLCFGNTRRAVRCPAFAHGDRRPRASSDPQTRQDRGAPLSICVISCRRLTSHSSRGARAALLRGAGFVTCILAAPADAGFVTCACLAAPARPRRYACTHARRRSFA